MKDHSGGSRPIITAQPAKVSEADRARLIGQQPVTVWLTGLSAAGKTTLAIGLDKALMDAKHPCFMLDGDNVRAGLNRDLGFGPEDRHENIRRIAEVARLFNDAGLIVICAFISPYRADRELARQIIRNERFIEVFVDAPLEVCERRDPKRLYLRARRGEIADFTGISAPYEPPQTPAAVMRTAIRGVDECVAELARIILRRVKAERRA